MDSFTIYDKLNFIRINNINIKLLNLNSKIKMLFLLIGSKLDRYIKYNFRVFLILIDVIW